MTLFCISDVHSYLEPLKEALAQAGFDENNPDHWLISCGDLFDRGPDSEELLYYIMSLERKILVKGNHDTLLEECCMREFPYSYDRHNGTVRTINSIGDAGEGYPFDTCCQRTWNKTAAYRGMLINYFETEHYIFVHSWLPTNVTYTHGKTYLYNEDWRSASDQAWESAMWGNPFEMAEQGLNKTGKVIIFGHWHLSSGWAKAEGISEFGEDAKWDIYRNDEQNIIALDTCTAYTGKVNVLVIKDEAFLGENKE